jgi:enoyl-CoA hydratase/carnithine racemase
MTAQDSRALFQQVSTASGHSIGFARLNAEQSLNALSLDMIRILDPQLRRWAQDPNIACVVLHGAGEKAFCAGGDIRGLYKAGKDHQGSSPHPTALEVFSKEYRLDYLLHRYPKPLLVWGSGIVFGGGLGLMAGASHRVVTETSRVTMPEITIGFFPDVGGSWFLPRMPGRSGLFLALTGAQLNGHDAIVGELADYFLQAADRDALFSRLLNLSWASDARSNHECLSTVLEEFSTVAASILPPSNLRQHAELIDRFCNGNSLSDIVARITAYNGDDAWLKRATATLAAGSPTSAALSWELQRRAEGLDLADVLRLELVVALQCCAHPNFAEGVRALLIDKDNAPRWTPKTLAEVTPQWLNEHFATPAWPNGEHPLSDL